MKRRPRRTLGLLLFCAHLASVSLAVGCASVVLEQATFRVERKNIVRITVLDVSGDVIQFQVENLSKEPLVVMKAEIEIEAYFGSMRHPPGTQAPVYEVAPKAKQRIAVKFTAKGLERGDELRVHFDRAIRQKGEPVALDPVIFYVTRARG